MTGYEVYRNGVLAGSTSGVSATSFAVTGLIPGTARKFTVKALDAAGNRSEASNEVNAVLAPPSLKAFDSGVLNATSTTPDIDLDISGVNELKLVVKNGGNGNDWDHADWGGARIIYPSGE